ncbi:MAG: RIP metalloprotease [Lachnospiraceae bacterium]|nr:RIP metalloprotease [Lachnospiraceae bacterium]
MRLIASLLVLSVIILFHEFGHFLFARLNGVAVLEFSLGFGPRLVSFVSKKSGTRYSVKCIPFGGSCAMKGEEAVDEEEEERKPEEDSFFAKSPLARISIIAAGPVFNFILAFVFSLFIIAWAGYDPPKLLDVSEGYPAEAAGLMAGDVVTKIDGRSVAFARDIQLAMMQNTGQPVRLTYKRLIEETKEWEEQSVLLKPKYSAEDKSYYIGIRWSSGRIGAENAGRLLLYGVCEVRTQIRMVVDSLKLLVSGQVGTDEIAGPVRIVTIIDETVEENKQYGFMTVFMNLLNLMVMFSANLGVLNLLPFPALDGGRLVFLFWELLTRRPVNARLENAVNLAGMALLMTFMVFVVFNDLRYLF